MVKRLNTDEEVRLSGEEGKAESYAVPALDKGLDVLELLAREPGGLTKTQIARELNRTISEIFRMLICLERRGYIAQIAGERFSLTLKMFRLVQEHPPTERLIATALPVMHELAHDTRQSCHLAVLERSRVVILAQLNAPTPIGFYVKPGSTVDMMEAASGYVLLANQIPQLQSRILQNWREDSGRQAPADLEIHLASIRAKGYERRSSYLVEGVTNISFPIFDHRGTAVAALTVPFIQFADAEASEQTVIVTLGRCAASISAAIGGSAAKAGGTSKGLPPSHPAGEAASEVVASASVQR